jgi:hypothetical protein
MDFPEFNMHLASGLTGSKSGLQYPCKAHRGSVYPFLF